MMNLRINIDNENVNSLKDFLDFIKQKSWTKYKKFKITFAPVEDNSDSGLKNILTEKELYDKINKTLGDINNLDKSIDVRTFKILSHIKTTFLEPNSISLPIISYCEAMAGL